LSYLRHPWPLTKNESFHVPLGGILGNGNGNPTMRFSPDQSHPSPAAARRWCVLAVLVCLAATFAAPAVAQVARVNARAQGGIRQLAPGVVTEIAPQIEEEETYSGPREMVELLQQRDAFTWQPNYLADTETLVSMAQNVVFRRQVWALEFGFKPLRLINLPVRNAAGQTVNQRVWYLVYYVKNRGRHLNPAPRPDAQGHELYVAERVDHSIRFFPKFVLQAHDVNQAYMDEVIPGAIRRIGQREDRGRTFYDSVSISSVTIPVSSEGDDQSVWGIATWTGVDPRSDFFSIFVQGLTNAYRWEDPPGAYRAGDPPLSGRTFTRKTLQLNFWRAGDANDPTEDEIHFGVPNEAQVPRKKLTDDILKIYGLQARVDYLWVYR
jgi:hypothetical protein